MCRRNKKKLPNEKTTFEQNIFKMPPWKLGFPGITRFWVVVLWSNYTLL